MKNNNRLLSYEHTPNLILSFGIVLFYFFYSCYLFSIISVEPSSQWIGIAFSAVIEGLCCCIFRNLFFATVSAELISFSIFYIDQFVYSARLTHIRYSDFAVAGEGLAVASHYSFPWNFQIGIRLLLLAAVILAQWFIYKSFKQPPRKKNIFIFGGGLTAIPVIGLFLCVSLNLYSTAASKNEMFDSNSYFERNGLFCTLFNQWQNSKVIVPDGYSAEAAAKILSEYESEPGMETDLDIIVIMNEAFTDYSLLGDIKYEDPLPNLHYGYGDELFEGKLLVSVRGGTTCNTEYEFLTGNSLSFLPEGSIPFSQYLHPNQNGIVNDLNNQGFMTEGIHPFYSQEWNRKQNYTYLGFKKMLFGENFGDMNISKINVNITGTPMGTIDFGDNLEYLRGFISDRECYRKIISELETADRSCFIFAVTIQNHGAYDYSEPDFKNKAFTDNFQVNQYLTCTEFSDRAFREFTDYLAQRERKTIVLMFGDHQPALDLELYVDFYSSNSFENEYTVPFLFWSNYDVPFDCPDITSPNYLSALLKEYAGLDLTSYDRFRLNVLRQYPVLSRQWAYSTGGDVISIEESESPLLSQYRYLTYYYQFQ